MKRGVLAALTASLAVLTFAAPAFAAGARLLEVDAQTSNVSVLVGGDADLTESDVSIKENGEERKVDSLQPALPDSVVFAVDVSTDMKRGERLEPTKAALRAFVAQKPAGQRVAIVSFSTTAFAVSDLTADGNRLNVAIDSLKPEGGRRSTLDAVSTAASLLNTGASERGSVVVLASGPDSASVVTSDAVVGKLISGARQIYSIGLGSGVAGDKDPADLAVLTAQAEGVYFKTDTAAAIDDAVSDVRDAMRRTVLVTYTSNVATGKAIRLEVNADGKQINALLNAGSKATGLALAPKERERSAAAKLFDNPLAVPVLAGLILFAVALFVFAMLQVFGRKNTLESMLRHYAGDPDSDDPEQRSQYVETELLKRAMAKTEALAESRGLLAKIATRFEQADIEADPAEILFFTGIVVALATVASAFLLNIFFAIIVLGLGLVVPVVIVNAMGTLRRKKFEKQLPDTLQLVASSLKAGFSFVQGLDSVIEQIDNPMKKEFRRALTDAQLGRPLEDALDEVAVRTRSDDFAWTVMAIRIQREVGGNLAELLETVAQTIVERTRLKREVAALTAEGRISAIILGLLPPALGVLFYIMNRPYMEVLFFDSLGRIMLGGGIILAVGGFIWMRSMLKVEI